MSTTDELALQAAADYAGVHYQTAYRWVRSGQLPARLVGSKYTVAVTDIDEFLRRRLEPTGPTAPSPKRIANSADKMHEAFVDGDEAKARALARSIVDEGTPVIELIQQVLVPPLRQIGQDWHDGKVSVWVEHRASAIVDRILGDIVPNPRGRRRGTAMVTAVEGDRHALPTSMAAVALRSHNWAVHHLGADMPLDDMLEFVRTHDIDLAVLTVTSTHVHGTVEEAARRIEAAGVATIIGAPGKTLHDLLDAADATRRSDQPASA